MIFTILKVIGIILLVVLALILTALLCVLFVPVKYRAVGSFDNTDIRAKAHASWLFHLFALHIEYADETDGYIRLAFVKRKLFDDADSDYENDEKAAEASDDDVMLITNSGTIIRINVKDVSILGRATQGVTLMRTNENEKVVSIETVEPEE